MIAVIYARYSSDSQREASIEGQLRDCKDYAEKNGITVVGTYIDRAYSAKTDDRPDFQRMIKMEAYRLAQKMQADNQRLWQYNRQLIDHIYRRAPPPPPEPPDLFND